MTRWTDPKVLAECARIFNITLVGLAGAYGWESILGLEQDWRFIKRLRRGNLWTRAPLCLYFACKYATLLSVIGVNYTNNVTQVIDCQIVYTVIELLGNIAIGSASTLLLLRCSALWRHYSPAIYPLITLSTAQWIILLYGSSTVRSSYAANGSCVVTGASSSFLAGLYSYTMALDFTVLVMTLLGISRLGTQSNNIWKLLSRNSITYCAVAVIVNAICMIIIVMRLNSIMNIMFSIPACVLSTIVACRSFTSIDEYKIANAQKPKQRPGLLSRAQPSALPGQQLESETDYKPSNTNGYEIHTLPIKVGAGDDFGTLTNPAAPAAPAVPAFPGLPVARTSQPALQPHTSPAVPLPLARSATAPSLGEIPQARLRKSATKDRQITIQPKKKWLTLPKEIGEESGIDFASIYTDGVASANVSVGPESPGVYAMVRGFDGDEGGERGTHSPQKGDVSPSSSIRSFVFDP